MSSSHIIRPPTSTNRKMKVLEVLFCEEEERIIRNWPEKRIYELARKLNIPVTLITPYTWDVFETVGEYMGWIRPDYRLRIDLSPSLCDIMETLLGFYIDEVTKAECSESEKDPSVAVNLDNLYQYVQDLTKKLAKLDTSIDPNPFHMVWAFLRLDVHFGLDIYGGMTGEDALARLANKEFKRFSRCIEEYVAGMKSLSHIYDADASASAETDAAIPDMTQNIIILLETLIGNSEYDSQRTDFAVSKAWSSLSEAFYKYTANSDLVLWTQRKVKCISHFTLNLRKGVENSHASEESGYLRFDEYLCRDRTITVEYCRGDFWSLEEQFIHELSGMYALDPFGWNNRNNKNNTLARFLQSLPWTRAPNEPTGLYLAGGSVSDTLRNIIYGKQVSHPPIIGSSDLDLFIIGDDGEAKRTLLAEILRKVQEHFGRNVGFTATPAHDIYYGVSGSVVTVWLSEERMSIQIVLRQESSARALLEAFDLTCTGVLWDGSHIHSTWEFMQALISWHSHARGSPSPSRLLKYNRKGWPILLPDTEVNRLLFKRYRSSSSWDPEAQKTELEFGWLQLPRATNLWHSDKNIYEIRKHFPHLTRELLLRSVHPKTQIDQICKTVRDEGSYWESNAQSSKIRPRILNVNAGCPDKLTWKEHDGSQCVTTYYPRLEGRESVWRLECNRVTLKEDRYASGPELVHSLLQVECSTIATEGLLSLIKIFFGNFLMNLPRPSRNGISKRSYQAQFSRVDDMQTRLKHFEEKTFITWFKKFQETGILQIRDRKWATAPVFYYGEKKEELGSAGTLLKDEGTITLGNYSVTLDLGLRVASVRDEYLPSIYVVGINLHDTLHDA